MLKYYVASYHICCTYIFSGFHVNKFCMKVEPNIELNPSNHKSVRRKMFHYYTLFLYAISLQTTSIPVDTRRHFNVYKATSIDVDATSCVYWDWAAEIISNFQCSTLLAKIEIKPAPNCFLSPNSSFSHSFHVFGAQKPRF